MVRTPLSRQWFQFSIGTMLLLVTLIAVWLAWQVRIVRERQAMRVAIKEHRSIVTTLKDWQPVPGATAPKISVPFWRKWMGDEPIVEVTLSHKLDHTEMEQVRVLFPEAQIRRRSLGPLNQQ
jgi:hypothetical protein